MLTTQDREFFYDQLLRASILPNSEGLSKLLTSNFFQNSHKLNWIFEKALMNKDARIIDFLLSSGLGIHRLNDVNQTALHLAARHNYLDVVDTLFNHCKLNYRDDHGLTHFHIACMAGNAEMVKHFLWNKVDINVSEMKDSFTPLHFAVLYRQVGVVELLLKHRADVNALDRFGRIPLHLICKHCSSLLLQKKFNVKVCLYDELRILELLLRFDSNVNSRDHLGNTPLMYVFQDDYSKQIYCSQMYLSKFEKRKILNKYEKMQKRKIELLLLRNKTNVQLVNNDDDTTLHVTINDIRRSRAACELYWLDDIVNVEVSKLLLRHGAHVNVKNKRNETPLQIAVSVMSLETVKLLLSYKADVKDLRLEEGCFQCFAGDLPCLEAIENLIEIIQVLCDKGFHMSLRSNLAVLKFFVPSNRQFYFENGKDENTADKLKNLLEYGTSESIQRALNDFPTNLSDTSLSEQYSRKRVIQQIQLYLTTLKTCNLYLSDATQRYLEEKTSNLRKYLLGCLLTTDTSTERTSDLIIRLQNELQLMKTTMLTKKSSLHDALRKNPHHEFRSHELSSILKTEDFSNRFSRCASIIKAHCAKSLVRHYVCRSAEECLPILMDARLPQLCCEKICQYLSNECLVNVCSAAAMMDESLYFEVTNWRSNDCKNRR